MPFQPVTVELSPTQPVHQDPDSMTSNDSFFGDLSGVNNPLQTVPAPPMPNTRRVSARWRSPKDAPGRPPISDLAHVIADFLSQDPSQSSTSARPSPAAGQHSAPGGSAEK